MQASKEVSRINDLHAIRQQLRQREMYAHYWHSQHPDLDPSRRRRDGGRKKVRPAHVVIEEDSEKGDGGPCCGPGAKSVTQQFSRDTTIHGIRQMFRREHHGGLRVAWAMVFIACTLATVNLVGQSLSRYLEYNVKTTTSLEHTTEVVFPAITFCNENLVRRSVVGGSSTFLRGIVPFVLSDAADFAQKYREVLTVCHTNQSESNTTRLMDAGSGYTFWLAFGIAKGMKLVNHDSDFSLAGCWWKGQAINCSNLFLNHFTDYSWCFTVNPNPATVKAFNLGLDRTATAYGLDDNHRLLKLKSTGPRNGLQLLLNVHHEEYCLTKGSAAGFRVLIHDPNIMPLFFLERPLAIAPGFETTVAIKITRMVKETERLGRCSKFLQLSLYPNSTVYFKEACYLQCFSELTYKQCGCIPPYGPPQSQALMAMQSGQRTVWCWADKLLCMKKYENQFLMQGLHVQCPHCVEPCEYQKYDFTISTSHFPAPQLLPIYSEVLNTTDIGEIRRNFLVATFYVESMQISVVTETREFTFDELVADIGGTIGKLSGCLFLAVALRPVFRLE
jgi:Amiloride-sensitive sodium channel